MTTNLPAEDDLARIESGLQSIETAADRAAGAISSAFTRGLVRGKDFDDVLKALGQRLIEIGLTAALKPLETGLANLLGGLTRGIGAAVGVPLTPFADGGVINAPSFFPMGRGWGLAGERGAEAILPLARGPDGRLGVAASGRAAATTQVHVTIATRDAESFRRSEAQVAASLSRAVARGQRAL